MMLDSLLRLLDRLASSRDAWRVAIAIALTAVVVVPAAPTVSRVAELTGVDPGWLYVITGVFFYAVSILLVNGILSGSRALQKRWSRHKASKQLRSQMVSQIEAMQGGVDLVLPYLTLDQHWTIRELARAGKQVLPRTEAMRELEGHDIVYPATTVGGGTLYCLHPATEGVTRSFIKRQRSEHLTATARNLSHLDSNTKCNRSPEVGPRKA